MLEYLKHIWRWLSHASTVITWWQLVVAAGGFVGMYTWAIQNLATPQAVTLAIVVGVALYAGCDIARRRERQRLRLIELRKVGAKLLNEILFSAADRPAWEVRVDAWRDETAGQIEKQFDKKKAEWFSTLVRINTITIVAYSVDDIHRQKQNALSERLRRLDAILGNDRSAPQS